MLYDAAIIEAVAAVFRSQRLRNLVVDPVMVATSGALLLKPGAVRVLTRKLFPLARVITPNLAELEALSGGRITTVTEMRTVARQLADELGVAVLAKGGHLPERGAVVDVLCDGRSTHEFRSVHVRHAKPHGAGCTFSAAIAANLAHGCELRESVARAKRFIARAIREPVRLGRYRALRV
jgi:hydroxymethylpyrimidine/phosphomethylpyrimidine kinase